MSSMTYVVLLLTIGLLLKNVTGQKQFYLASTYRDNDFNDPASEWAFARSQESENFIVFWNLGFGTTHPTQVATEFRFDPTAILSYAEEAFQLNTDVLGFATSGDGSSKLDNYKIMIFVTYSTSWSATGAGLDDTAGGLWVTSVPARNRGTIGHEVGHVFQYMVGADLGPSTNGFRYGFGPNGSGGNGFWEQSAQWQSFQLIPQDQFVWIGDYNHNYHRHFCHERMRYASVYNIYYWAQKHGVKFLGRLWREALRPEDPVQAYMRITNIDTETFNDEFYDASAKLATYDLDALRSRGAAHINNRPFAFTTLLDGSWQVTPERAPGTTGYNMIPLDIPSSGTHTALFTGLPNEPGYNSVDASRAGWRYGYVALRENGVRDYGEMHSGISGSVSYTVPQDTARLWFIVTGAPNVYVPHNWDDDLSNDDQWPYKVLFNAASFNERDGVVQIDAELGILGSQWVRENNINALSGGVIRPLSNHVGNSPEGTSSEFVATYNFHLQTPGNYRFWFRMLSSSVEDDSFFWRIDDGPWVLENGRFNGWYSTENAQVDSIDVGSHTLQVSYREDGTLLDAFIIQLDTHNAPVIFTGDESIYIEAELGRLGSHWDVMSEGIQIGPAYSNTAGSPIGTSAEYLATYNFVATSSGNYRFWFNLLSTADTDDSFFWRIDSGPWVLENGRQNGWFSRDSTQLDSLQAGMHTLDVTYREDGTLLDAFVIQLDSAASPAGSANILQVVGGTLSAAFVFAGVVFARRRRNRVNTLKTVPGPDELPDL